MKLSYLLFLLNISCSINNNSSISDSTLSNKSNLNKENITFANVDSSIFKKQKNSYSKLHLLDEAGALNIDSLKIKISLKENKNDKYDLWIYKNGKSIFNERNVEGVSKFFINEKLLMFSIFSLFTEDGRNEGKALIYNLDKNKIIVSSKKLNNTCNPIVLNEDFYLVDNLRLMQVDKNFNPIKEIPIYYNADSDNYLDSFLICSLDIEKKDLLINFSPQKSLNPCAEYKGSLNPLPKKIVLLD